MIIWNDGSGNQTADLKYTNQGLYTGTNKGTISCNAQITAICDDFTAVENIGSEKPLPRKILLNGALYLIMPNGKVYDVLGNILNTTTAIE